MKADLSRSTDQPGKHYRGVRMQQGRVQLDADWNEQQDILNRRLETETRDSIGKSGVPIANPGFLLDGNGQNIDVSAGRLYLEGLLCENPAPLALTSQPDLDGRISPIMPAGASLLPLPPAGANAALTAIRVYSAAGNPVQPENGLYLGYLEAWLRHVTALEDGLIREVALGGPDSATRDQLVWQIKLLRVGALNADLDCLSDIAAWNELGKASDGKLAVRAEPGTPPKDPCLLTPEAGYQRLENQLYRVEVHEDGVAPAKLRYKWSRDNGSILTRLTGWLNDPAPDEIEVASIGRDPYLAITAGCWLEIFNDDHEQTGRGGPLVQVLKTEGNRVTLDVANATEPLGDELFARHPRVRRWDGWAPLNPVAPNAGDNTGWVELEDGVEVRFLAGKLRVGDYWTIPARTATAGIEWPQAGGKPAFAAPQGVLRAFTRLALLRCQAGVWTRVSDCRNLFPALTELTNLYYIGGDGQQAMPDPLNPQRVALPSPLEVAVYNGQFPVAGAQVRFHAPQGLLQNGAVDTTATTGPDGIASVEWFLAPGVLDQTCTAELLEAGQPAPGKYADIHFSARLAVAAAVAYDPANCADMQAAGVNTVQAALDSLCQRNHAGGCCVTVGKTGEFPTLDLALRELLERGERDICLCLLPGDHQLSDDLVLDAKGEVNLLVHGAGPASRLHLRGEAFELSNFAGLVLRDFDLLCPEVPQSLRLFGNVRLHLQHLALRARSEPGRSLLQIGGSVKAELTQLIVEATQQVAGGGSNHPGFALMLADGTGDVLVADCRIVGRVSLYGESTKDLLLNQDQIKRLGPLLNLKGQFGSLRLRNDRVIDLRLADEIMELIMQQLDTGGEVGIPVSFFSLVAETCSFGNSFAQFLASNLALDRNVFDPDGELAGMALALQGKYLGNFCNRGALLMTAGHNPESFGNGALQVV